MHELLAAIPGVTCLAPQGAFYCFPSFEGVLGREIAGRTPTNTLELCEMLLEEARVAIVPGEAFGAPGYARLSFALCDEALVDGVERIAKLLSGAEFLPPRPGLWRSRRQIAGLVVVSFRRRARASRASVRSAVVATFAWCRRRSRRELTRP